MPESRIFVYRKDGAPTERPTAMFVTPLLCRKLKFATPDFLARLKAYVVELEARDKGLTLSNVGGWHSSNTLFETQDEDMRRLAAALLAAAGEMSYWHFRDIQPECAVEVAYVGAWANVSRDGNYNKPHLHPGVLWSGVFYVDLGDRDPEPRDNGAIEFIDPRPGNLYSTKRVLRPEAGEVVIFPGWLTHYVNPFRGRGERISIAFNVNAKMTPIPEQRSG